MSPSLTKAGTANISLWSSFAIIMRTYKVIINSCIRGRCQSNAKPFKLRTDLPQHAFMMGERENFCTNPTPKSIATKVAVEVPATILMSFDPDDTPIKLVESEEELQEEWKSLERRVSNRKLRPNDGSGPSGRSKRNASAWDAENN